MKNLFTFLLIVSIFSLNLPNFALADNKKPQAKTATRDTQTLNPNDLIWSLPNSDAVVSMDTQKLLNEALPQILAGSPTRLADINQKIDEMKAKTGIDLRTFEKIVAGVNFIHTPKSKTVEIAPLVLARGSFNSGALLAAARLAANGKYQEVKYGNKTIYVISTANVGKNSPKPTTTKDKDDSTENLPAKVATKTLGMSFDLIGNQIAVAAFDDKTLAIGDLARVKESLNGLSGKNRLNNEIAQMVTKNPNAVMSFAGNLPPKMSAIIGVEEAELAKTLDTIRQMSGFLEMSDGNAIINVAARTQQNDQAQQLEETLNFLKMLGGNMLGQKKDDMSKIYTRAIDSAKISRVNNDVELTATVNSADVQKLAAKL